MDCLFCKIASREIASEIIYEDPSAVAFLDIHPRAPGHTVVVPRSHAETILDISRSDLHSLFTAVKTVTEGLARTLSPEGFTIGINHGRVGGQMVDHLHVHVIPRFTGDGGGSIHGVVHNPPTDSLAVIAEAIRKNMRKAK